MNWGGFAGGFSQGFQNGTKIGTTFKDAMKEHQLQKLREQGIAEAQAARSEEIDKLVKQNPIESPEVSDKPLTDAQPVQTGAVSPASQGLSGPRPVDAPAPATATPASAPAQASPAQSSQTTPATPDTNAPDRTAAATTGTAPASITPQATSQGQVQPSEPAAATGIAGTQPTQAKPTPQLPWSVGSQSFATREEAMKAAEKHVGSITDFITDKVTPKLQEYYVANGDIEKANQLQTYMDSKRGKDAVKQFGKAMATLMFTNDVNGGVQELGHYYNHYIDDGVDFTKGEVGPDGKINITVKNRDSGKESVMSLTQGELVRLGMAHDPAQLFKMGLAQVEKKEAAQAEIAKEKRKFQSEVALKGVEHGFRQQEKTADQNFQLEKLTTEKQLDAANAGAKAKAEARSSMDILRQNGYTEEQVRGLLPSILKLGEYKKVTDPTERRAIIVTELSKNPMFVGKSAEELSAEADKMMSVIYKGGATPGAKGSATTPSPAASGMSGKGKGKGVPWYNPATKQIEYR